MLMEKIKEINILNIKFQSELIFKDCLNFFKLSIQFMFLDLKIKFLQLF